MKIKYQLEIDVLRAIAVIAVILYHSNLTLYGYNLTLYGYKVLQGGFIGVDIFYSDNNHPSLKGAEIINNLII